MKLSTAFKISGVCLAAIGVEAVAAYLIFANYATTLAETGQYTLPEAYSSGPLGVLAKVFYGLFGVTLAIGIGAPLVALISVVFQRRSESGRPRA
jgi:hypothetical protein